MMAHLGLPSIIDNPKWLALAADLLELASDKFSNHRCNDFDFPEDWTEADQENFRRLYHTVNGDPESFEAEDTSVQDNCAMWLLAQLLRAAAREPDQGRKRCPKCGSRLNCNGMVYWCSFIECDYGLKERVYVKPPEVA